MAASTTGLDPAPAPGAAAGDCDRLTLTIAGVALDVEAQGGVALTPPAWEYPRFLDAAAASHRIAVTVRPRDAATPPRSDGTRLAFDTGDGWRLHRGKGERAELFRFVAANPLSRRPWVWAMDTRRPFDRWVLHAPRRDGGEAPATIRIQYPIDQIILTHALAPLGGVLVHAAGVALPGGGIVLPGVSGAGKSTLSRHLLASPDIRALSDDRIVVRCDGDGPRAHGTPWAGDARIARAGSAPLRALCFLTQATVATLLPLSPAGALHRLLPVTTLAWYEPPLLEQGLAVCARIVESVPCFELRFPPDGDGVATLLGELAGAGT